MTLRLTEYGLVDNEVFFKLALNDEISLPGDEWECKGVPKEVLKGFGSDQFLDCSGGK